MYKNNKKNKTNALIYKEVFTKKLSSLPMLPLPRFTTKWKRKSTLEKKKKFPVLRFSTGQKEEGEARSKRGNKN